MTGKTLTGWKAEYRYKIPAWTEKFKYQIIVKLANKLQKESTVGWKAIINGKQYGNFMKVDPSVDLSVESKDWEMLETVLLDNFEVTLRGLNESKDTKAKTSR